MTPLEIANLVFTFLNLGSVGSLKVKEPRITRFNNNYPSALKRLLQLRDWTFLNKTVQLVRETSSDDIEFQFHYVLPEDCLKVRGVYANPISLDSQLPTEERSPLRGTLLPAPAGADLAISPYDLRILDGYQNETIAYKISNGVLHTNAKNPLIRYTRMDVNGYVEDATLGRALAYRIAADMANFSNAPQWLVHKLEMSYKEELDEAQRQDSEASESDDGITYEAFRNQFKGYY